MKSPLRIFFSLLLVLPLLLLGGCPQGSSDDEDDGSPKLRVGMELQYPPFEGKDASGKPTGVSVDLAGELAASMGKTAKIIDMPFDELIPSLESGKIDVIISSMTITQERQQRIDFSDPYLSTGLCILAGGRSNVFSINDVDRPGMKVVVKAGTTGEKWAKANLKSTVPMSQAQEADCLKMVAEGEADCFIYDQISTFKNWQKNQVTTRALLIPFQKEQWAVGVRKGNDDIRLKINAFLERFRAKGGFDRLGDKYLKDQKEAFQRLGFPFYL